MSQSKDRKNQLTNIADCYFESLRNTSFSSIPYHEEVILRAPIAPGGSNIPLEGKEAVYEKWWKPLEPALASVQIEIDNHYFDPDLHSVFTKVLFHFEVPKVSLRVADLFIIDQEGLIVEQENHFDPRPLQVFGPTMKANSISPITLGIHHITLRTLDQVRTKRFYGDILGFPILIESPELLIFAAGRTFIAFKIANPRNMNFTQFSPFEVGLDHIALACESEEELERITKSLESKGVENTGIKTDETLNKKYVAFKDPDRIQWEFYMI